MVRYARAGWHGTPARKGKPMFTLTEMLLTVSVVIAALGLVVSIIDLTGHRRK